MGRLKDKYTEKEQEGSLLRVKVNELGRQAKQSALPPIVPIVESKGIDAKISMIKKSKQRQSSLSLGVSRRKPRDISALPTYNRDISSNNIMDLRKGFHTPSEKML